MLGLVVGALVAVGCVGATDGAPPVAGIEVPDGFEVVEIVTGLNGPTQLNRLPDGRLLVAELNGGEKDGDGRVLAIEPGVEPAIGAADGATVEVLADGLLTPTGVAAVGGELWIMEQRALSRGPLDGGARTTVLADLPFNGRSETTLTATDQGTVLYGTSGSSIGADGRPQADSGILWELDPDGEPIALSAGFKNAYAHVVDGDGQLWVTEVSDGRFDGERAPDELVAVTPGVDHGWPRCIGDRTPVVEFGADAGECEPGPPSQALFAPGATPTSVVVSPWDADQLLVALWVEQRVVAVPTATEGRPQEPADVVTGEFRPQHLLVDGDRLLIVEVDDQ
ncbi:MAG: glucose sorbosone dehydrogenase, partial [Actinomycetota bacterium]